MTKQRQRRSEAQKAQAVLDTADRLIERLEKRRGELNAELTEVFAKLKAAEARREYLAANPALKPPAEVTERVSAREASEDYAASAVKIDQVATPHPGAPLSPSGDPFDWTVG